MINRINNSSEYLPLSILDLVPILEGATIEDSFKNSLTLAQEAEKLGYNRFWLAEHHNMAGIASSATAVLIGYIAGGTSTIRVGSGGIMLPNHSPLVVAEQFGTLAHLYPNRIDLGLGRAPGTDQLTAMALRRHLSGNAEDFPNNVQELRRYFHEENKSAKVRAVQAEGVDIPFWLLGSSTFSAQLAAILGLPFSFASHFAPNLLHNSLQLYRETFQPSSELSKPYAMAGVNVIAADTDEEAHYLATSLYLAFLNVIRGTASPLKPPVDDLDDFMDISERYALNQMLAYTFIGSAATVEAKLQAFIERTKIDELMVVSTIYDQKARIRSFEILAGLELKTSDEAVSQNEQG
jgi:luciferase family oxidoreductase group 1